MNSKSQSWCNGWRGFNLSAKYAIPPRFKRIIKKIIMINKKNKSIKKPNIDVVKRSDTVFAISSALVTNWSEAELATSFALFFGSSDCLFL